jgi:hypothetical protein
MRPLLRLSLSITIGLIPVAASAQWALDGAPLCTAASAQYTPSIVSDGAGGAIVAWMDYRVSNLDIYVQRVNASGVPQWTANGVALCTAIDDQVSPVLVSDGAGGAIAVWTDFRSGTADIYARRVNASGVPQWTADGVALSTAANNQLSPAVVSDGAGGAIAVWHDISGGFDFDIYARRINASGTPQWTANGVALSTAFNDQLYPVLISDGAGGAIAVWSDYRGGTGDIYARRINATGTPQWTADGVAICTAANAQEHPVLVADGAGGAIIAWDDRRAGVNSDLYIQRVNSAGTPQWTANGTVICTVTNDQEYPSITSDGAGGAIVAWEDFRSGSDHDIFAQRVVASGSPLWTENGVAVALAPYSTYNPNLVSDGAGGAILAWQDDRNGFNFSDLFMQRLDALGAAQWTPNGAVLASAPGYQSEFDLVVDGAGGTIVTWADYRSGFYSSHIYAQRVENHYGYWGHPEPIVKSVADIPKDNGGRVAINWTPSGRDLSVPRTIDHYTVWRAVDVIPAPISNAPAVLTDISDVGQDADGPVYAVLSSLSGYYWELVGTQSANAWTGYSFSAATRADSVAGNSATETFMVAAHIQYDTYVAFPSNSMSGHSVDNLAPAAPLMLTAQRVGADVHLKWNRVRVPDLRDYSLYRATASGVTPVPINFLATAEETLLVDAGAPSSALYYIVTAFDVHQNQSPPSNEASVGALTGIGNTPPITALSVLDNVPNPFNSRTTLRVGLPRASDLEIEVYDVGGRRLRTEHTASLAAGWREVPFEARDAGGHLLPNGVYFYRVTAAGQSIKGKMVIAR